jgi:Tol biopolymer transport system component
MPAFEPRTPQEERNRTHRIRIAAIARKLGSWLTAHRLRSLLIGGAFLFVMAAVPVGLLVNSEATSVELRVSCPKGSDDADNQRQQAPHGYITFLSKFEGDYDIYVMNENGGELRNLTNTSANELGAVWSPDDQEMAVVTYRWQGHSLAAGLYVMNSDGTGKHFYHEKFAPEAINFLESVYFSPDSKKLAFAAPQEDGEHGYYHVMHTDGTGQARLTDFSGELPYDLFWSPDSEKIAFMKENTSMTKQLGRYPRDIYVVNADGGGLKNITKSSNSEDFSRMGDNYGWRVWSSDSRMISFFREAGTRETGTGDSGSSEEIVGKELVVKADGTDEPVEPTDVRSSCPWPTTPGAADTHLTGRFVRYYVTPTNDGNKYEFDRSAVLSDSEWSSVKSPDGKMSLVIRGPR